MSQVKKNKKNGLFPSLSSVVDSFFGENERLTNWLERNKLPAVNVKETDDNYILEVAAPGITKEEIEISVDKGILNISSESKFENEETKDNYTRKEFSFQSFNRSFWLPDNVTEDDIKAGYENGVLNISIPKKEVEDSKLKKTIEIS